MATSENSAKIIIKDTDNNTADKNYEQIAGKKALYKTLIEEKQADSRKKPSSQRLRKL